MSPDDAFDDLTAAFCRQGDGGDGGDGNAGGGGGHGEVSISAVFSIHTMKACRLFVARWHPWDSLRGTQHTIMRICVPVGYIRFLSGCSADK